MPSVAKMNSLHDDTQSDIDLAANQKSPTKNVSLAKAAFLCVKESLSQEIEHREEFKNALQHAGYNPTSQFLDRYWTSDNEAITFQQFGHILQTEPLPRKLDIISYFRQLDPAGQGTVSHDDLLIALTTRGEAMSPEAVKEILQNPVYNRNDRFDYNAFCQEVFNTSAELAKLAMEKAAKREELMELNSKTYKVKKGHPSPSKSKWPMTKMKGAFYFEGESIISHQYTFQIKQECNVNIAIEPSANSPVDCQFFLFKVDSESKLQFVTKSALVMTKDFVSSENLEDTRSWTGSLKPGNYLIIPSTTGCILKKRKSQPDSDVKLVKSESTKVTLTEGFVDTLKTIFHQVDLDGNGTLSRMEFNLFNWRTSGEEVQDEEWEVVKENFALENGELTLDGFLQLHQMEAEDNGGDSAELWITLNSMGFNASLVQDESATFEIFLRTESGEPVDLNVSGLKSGGSILDKVTIKSIMESTKKTKKVDKSDNVILYREDTGHCASFVLQNRSSHSVKVNMDFRGSRNALINHPHLNFGAQLSPKSTLFVATLIRKDLNKDFVVQVKENLVK